MKKYADYLPLCSKQEKSNHNIGCDKIKYTPKVDRELSGFGCSYFPTILISISYALNIITILRSPS